MKKVLNFITNVAFLVVVSGVYNAFVDKGIVLKVVLMFFSLIIFDDIKERIAKLIKRLKNGRKK